MSYSNQYIGKPLGQLTYADVVDYFATPKEETDLIEFKSYHPDPTLESQIQVISEAISSFLNSGGGLIIWGAPVGLKQEGKKERIFMGQLTHLPASIEKDALISKVSDKIIPLPTGIRV